MARLTVKSGVACLLLHNNNEKHRREIYLNAIFDNAKSRLTLNLQKIVSQNYISPPQSPHATFRLEI
jgi:hypothetical protein